MRRILTLAFLLLALAGCGGGSSDNFAGDSFVLNLVDDTSESAEPVDINGKTLGFTENPQAFDELFQ